jgi:hypothetical protein
MIDPNKTRALLIGIDYERNFAQHIHLMGCANDVQLFKALLVDTFRVPDSEVQVLTDSKDPKEVAWAEIVLAIHNLSVDSWKKDLDAAVFFFSGHGSQVFAPDRKASEADGLDEGIAPSDYKERGLIIDSYIRRLFEGFNPKTKVICVFDCCHSGSIMDLPFYNLTDKGLNSFVSTESEQPMDANITLWSACMDKQVSVDYVDTVTNAKFGALTKFMVDILKEHGASAPMIDIQEMINRAYKEHGFNQTCVLSASKNEFNGAFM